MSLKKKDLFYKKLIREPRGRGVCHINVSQPSSPWLLLKIKTTHLQIKPPGKSPKGLVSIIPKSRIKILYQTGIKLKTNAGRCPSFAFPIPAKVIVGFPIAQNAPSRIGGVKTSVVSTAPASICPMI